MRELLRRTALMASLSLWLGGLTFYGAVVIRVATRVVGSHVKVGFITQEVASWLNVAACAALAVAFADLLRPAAFARARWAAWTIAAAAQASLFAVKPALDVLLDPTSKTVSDHDRFYRLHQVYLALTAVEWAAGIAILVLALAAWRRRDLTPDRR